MELGRARLLFSPANCISENSATFSRNIVSNSACTERPANQVFGNESKTPDNFRLVFSNSCFSPFISDFDMKDGAFIFFLRIHGKSQEFQSQLETLAFFNSRHPYRCRPLRSLFRRPPLIIVSHTSILHPPLSASDAFPWRFHGVITAPRQKAARSIVDERKAFSAESFPFRQ